MDLLGHLARKIGFEYKVYLVPNGSFGSKEDDGSWNGLIGEIMRGVIIQHIKLLFIIVQVILRLAQPFVLYLVKSKPFFQLLSSSV